MSSTLKRLKIETLILTFAAAGALTLLIFSLVEGGTWVSITAESIGFVVCAGGAIQRTIQVMHRLQVPSTNRRDEGGDNQRT